MEHFYKFTVIRINGEHITDASLQTLQVFIGGKARPHVFQMLFRAELFQKIPFLTKFSPIGFLEVRAGVDDNPGDFLAVR